MFLPLYRSYASSFFFFFILLLLLYPFVFFSSSSLTNRFQSVQIFPASTYTKTNTKTNIQIMLVALIFLHSYFSIFYQLLYVFPSLSFFPMLLCHTHAHYLSYPQKDTDSFQGRPLVAVINSIKAAISSTLDTTHAYNVVDRFTTDNMCIGPRSAPLSSVCAVFDSLSLAYSAANVARWRHSFIFITIYL